MLELIFLYFTSAISFSIILAKLNKKKYTLLSILAFNLLLIAGLLTNYIK